MQLLPVLPGARRRPLRRLCPDPFSHDPDRAGRMSPETDTATTVRATGGGLGGHSCGYRQVLGATP